MVTKILGGKKQESNKRQLSTCKQRQIPTEQQQGRFRFEKDDHQKQNIQVRVGPKSKWISSVSLHQDWYFKGDGQTKMNFIFYQSNYFLNWIYLLILFLFCLKYSSIYCKFHHKENMTFTVYIPWNWLFNADHYAW